MIVQIEDRHIKLMEKMQKAYNFSAMTAKEDALRAGFIEDEVTASEILSFLLEVVTGTESQEEAE